jgi:hypothetical protein
VTQDDTVRLPIMTKSPDGHLDATGGLLAGTSARDSATGSDSLAHLYLHNFREACTVLLALSPCDHDSTKSGSLAASVSHGADSAARAGGARQQPAGIH